MLSNILRCTAVLVLSGCSVQGTARGQQPSLYQCADGRFFAVARSDEAAQVDFYDEQYRLPRRPSGIGARYASQNATLIIDGDSAVFVTENIVDLRACRAGRA